MVASYIGIAMEMSKYWFQ